MSAVPEYLEAFDTLMNEGINELGGGPEEAFAILLTAGAVGFGIRSYDNFSHTIEEYLEE